MSGSPRLGMGTAYLVGALDYRASERMVHMALERGVRYFDTAPLYGYGTAEETLARALRGRREGVMIATKVGLSTARASAPRLLLRSALAPLRRLRRGPPAAPIVEEANDDAAPRGRFDVPFVAASVAASRKALRVDRIDVLLLHEARPEDVSEPLIAWLERAKVSGLIGTVGIGSSRTDVEAAARRWPDLFEIGQYGWSALDPTSPVGAAKRTITHRAVMGALGPLTQRLAEPGWRAEASAAAGIDLAAPAALANTLLGAALALNPAGLALVASRSLQRMRSNLDALDDPRFAPAGERLWTWLHAAPGRV